MFSNSLGFLPDVSFCDPVTISFHRLFACLIDFCSFLLPCHLLYTFRICHLFARISDNIILNNYLYTHYNSDWIDCTVHFYRSWERRICLYLLWRSLLKLIFIFVFLVIKFCSTGLHSRNVWPHRARIWSSGKDIQRVVLHEVFPFNCGTPLKKLRLLGLRVANPLSSKPIPHGDLFVSEIYERKVPVLKGRPRWIFANFSVSILVILFEEISEFVDFLFC